nr:tetratricopeptide repeat protein [PVC group bacterium]
MKKLFHIATLVLIVFATTLSTVGQEFELIFKTTPKEKKKDTDKNAEIMGREGIRSALQTLLIPYVSELQRLSGEATGDVVKGSATLQKMYEALDLVMEADELILDAKDYEEDGDIEDAEDARKEAKLKYRNALPKLEAVFREDPTLIAVWATLGWTYWLVDRREDTIDLWNNVRDLNPEDPRPYSLLGMAYFATKRLKAAEDNFKKSLERDPDQPDVRLRLGILYRWLSRFQKSVDFLKALLADDPDRLDVQNELAMSLYLNRNFEEALELLPIARRSEPNPDKSIQYALAEIRALLFSGKPDQAIELLEEFLEAKPDSVELLILRADAPCYKNRPEEAIPFLSKVLTTTDNPDLQREIIRRLVDIITRLWKDDPAKYPLERPIRLVRKVIKSDPELVEWHLLLGELLLMNNQYFKAGKSFNKVLADFNPQNLRALKGLLEVNQATGNTVEAKDYLDLVKHFNESDPYHHERNARFELSRNSPQRSYKAIDELEKTGLQGAVAVLMYRGLSRSDWSGRVSMRQFHEHLSLLKSKGFIFLSAEELPDYLARHPKHDDDNMSEHTPEKAVVICFDSPRENTMGLAAEVASNINIPLSTFIPVGVIESGLTTDTDWESLTKHQNSGIWSFGSFLMNSHKLVPIDEAGHMGGSLANRAMLESGDLETDQEFLARLQDEYAESKRIANLQLGDNSNFSFLLYPQGDIGQAAGSNCDRAIAANQAEARSYYRCAFINLIHGYAIKGDNPMLFQYYSPGIFDTGEDLYVHLLEHHPVFLARKLRAEIASLDGRIYRAEKMIKTLERDGYPELLLSKLKIFVRQHLAQNFEATAEIEHSKKRRYSLSLEKPYVGIRGKYYEDSDERENWRIGAYAGVDPVPQLVVEGYADRGELKQGATTNNLVVNDDGSGANGRHYRVDETTIGAKAS